jgi:hypothetical protein
MTQTLPPSTGTTLPPNTVASFSDLGTFNQCRRRWWLATYRRLRRIDEPPTGPLPFGSRIHAALEAFYDGTVADPATAWNALMQHEFAVDSANGGWHTQDLDKESKLGHRMLEGYLEWLAETGEDAYWDVIGVETKLSHFLTVLVDTPDGDQEVTVLVRGKLDRRKRRRSDGAVYVDDFKTMGNFGEPAMLSLELSPQPRLYRMLEIQQAPPEQHTAGVSYTLLRKVLRTPTAKPPFYKRVTIEVNDAEQEAYNVRLQGNVTDLARVRYALDHDGDPRRVAYFQPGWWCATCPFKLPCGLMQHTPKAAEDMLADLYTETDPWARYMSDQTGDAEINGGPS